MLALYLVEKHRTTTGIVCTIYFIAMQTYKEVIVYIVDKHSWNRVFGYSRQLTWAHPGNLETRPNYKMLDKTLLSGYSGTSFKQFKTLPAELSAKQRNTIM